MVIFCQLACAYDRMLGKQQFLVNDYSRQSLFFNLAGQSIVPLYRFTEVREIAAGIIAVLQIAALFTAIEPKIRYPIPPFQFKLQQFTCRPCARPCLFIESSSRLCLGSCSITQVPKFFIKSSPLLPFRDLELNSVSQCFLQMVLMVNV